MVKSKTQQYATRYLESELRRASARASKAERRVANMKEEMDVLHAELALLKKGARASKRVRSGQSAAEKKAVVRLESLQSKLALKERELEQARQNLLSPEALMESALVTCQGILPGTRAKATEAFMAEQSSVIALRNLIFHLDAALRVAQKALK